ncbi:MAG: hypothetical protein QW607_07230 [Desulfurococcaceae archaeon]
MGKGRIKWDKIRWGTLTAWLKKHRSSIKRKYGDPFTKDGEINDKVLRQLYKDEEFLKKLSGSQWKRIKRKIHFKLNVLGD